jgi:molybdopterin converting factor subunit 1
VKVTVRLFARARDLAGVQTTLIELPVGASVADFRRGLVEEHPALKAILPHLLVAVDNEYATDSAILSPGAEVAVFPPVSGG